jgi:hypothetical protein
MLVPEAMKATLAVLTPTPFTIAVMILPAGDPVEGEIDRTVGASLIPEEIS